jgi:hypothetical protein
LGWSLPNRWPDPAASTTATVRMSGLYPPGCPAAPARAARQQHEPRERTG